MTLRPVFDVDGLRAEFENAKICSKSIPSILKYVFQNPRCELNRIPNLPAAAHTLLYSKFKPLSSSVFSVTHSSDEVTTKLLIKLKDDSFVETVIMRYDSTLGKYGGKRRPGGPRATLCVSSQVGCQMGCKFCATGTMGLKKNLSSSEIVEQLVHASQFSTIRNVVFMGMGEPLNNYTAVVESVHAMTAPPFSLSPGRITVSTVGIIHAIKKICMDMPKVNLAVSLHAPCQDLRGRIMPIAARAFPLDRLMLALQSYQRESDKRIFVQYVMLEAVNDEAEHAHALGRLLDSFRVVVNLIPYNPTEIAVGCFRSSGDERVKRFQEILRGSYNIRTTVRRHLGRDISGACGQLLPDIEDLQLSKHL